MFCRKKEAAILTDGRFLHEKQSNSKNREFSLNNPIYYYEQNKIVLTSIRYFFGAGLATVEGGKHQV